MTFRDTAAPPVIVVEPPRGWARIGWADLWAHRELAWMLMLRNIQTRYKQAVLGGLWAILQPAFTALVLAVVFSSTFRDSIHGTPYLLFVYTGTLPWLLLSSIVGNAAVHVVDNAHILTKVYFPRLLIPLAVTGYAVLDFVVGFVILVVLMIGFGVHLGLTVLFVPLVVVAILAAAIGVGVMLSALTARYRDFRFVVQFLLQLWFFASPVIYPPSILPRSVQSLMILNPMAGLISAFRHVLLGTPLEGWPVAVAAMFSVGLLLLGLVYFRQVEHNIADVV
jgi:ABC-type polysaccharide/polyol phosphate export systems, permease component